ncbi:MAG: hypothetical protein K0S12_2141 [Bacteroidetes bacterium]|nr:hypothetical protein [Bacteroidota bacterium]
MKLLPLCIFVFFMSCDRKVSYRLDPQTLFKKDGKGWRQGIWLTPVSKDTVIFLNDTGHVLNGMTSGELIRYIQANGNKNLAPLTDSMNIRIR